MAEFNTRKLSKLYEIYSTKTHNSFFFGELKKNIASMLSCRRVLVIIKKGSISEVIYSNIEPIYCNSKNA
jgi:hypothetical protein